MGKCRYNCGEWIRPMGLNKYYYIDYQDIKFILVDIYCIY